jgi:hypothetical protein
MVKMVKIVIEVCLSSLLRQIAEAQEPAETIKRCGKPDWSDAPEWACWLAVDLNGSWYWYEEKPEACSAAKVWLNEPSSRCKFAGRQDRASHWGLSLEQRQRSPGFSVNWETAPHWARFAAQDPDGDVYWYERRPFIEGGSWNQNEGRWAYGYNAGLTIPWCQSLSERE